MLIFHNKVTTHISLGIFISAVESTIKLQYLINTSICLIVVGMVSNIQMGINPDWNMQFNPRHKVSIKIIFPINLLTPNDNYSGRTAPLTSKRCILYIYSTHICIEYFKHGIYSPFFPLQNAVCFIILTYLVPGIFTFYIQGVLKLKK